MESSGLLSMRKTKEKIYLFSLTPSSNKEVVHTPLQRVEPLLPMPDLSGYDALIFTSKTAIKIIDQATQEYKNIPSICVGDSTSKELLMRGGTLLESASGYGDELYNIIKSSHGSKRLLFVRAQKIASNFSSRLRDDGVKIDESIVYRTVCVDTKPVDVDERAILIFTAPSTVECFSRLYGFTGRQKIVAIGSTTVLALLHHKQSCVIAQNRSIESCIQRALKL